jgi:hypothetical protein
LMRDCALWLLIPMSPPLAVGIVVVVVLVRGEAVVAAVMARVLVGAGDLRVVCGCLGMGCALAW